ncbi:MAG: PIN domain-containing protein [Streptosporangiaceae bacterium]
MNVLDASALLAFLQGEDGSASVEAGLRAGAACGTANWSEVAQKIRAHGRDWGLARALLASYNLHLEPVTVADAEQAAVTWAPGTGLSLADRLCLALGHRMDAIVLTADTSWGSNETIRQIR